MRIVGLLFSAFLLIGGPVRGKASPMVVQVAEARHGMVAAGHPDATSAGVAVLQAGGNAVDAAVAVSFALGVTEPYGSGMGGKLSLVYREAKTGRVMVVEAMDEASHHLVPAEFRALSTEQRKVGAQTVAVPGQVAGILEAHRRWGSRPRAELIAPAIKLAESGFEVRPAQVMFFRAQQDKLTANFELGRIYLPGGKVPVAGSRVCNPDLAQTLRLVAEKGADGFYKGPVAAAMVKALREAGSPLRADDFASYEARVTEPLRVKFRGTEVFSVPPPVSGGGVFLLTLAALDVEKPAGGSVLTPEALDHLMRVFLEVDSACREVLGHQPASREKWQALLGADRVAALRKQALAPATEAMRTTALNSAVTDEQADGFEAMAAETTHFVVVDQAGDVVSATQSQSNHFGSGIVPPGTGVVLNNSLSNFNRISGNPNEVAPGKRPRSTITPAVLVRDGRLLAALGVPGGSRIPSAMVQVTVDYLMFGRSLEDAIGAPRFHAVSRKSGDSANRFETEKETDYRLADALKTKFGWKDGTDSETESFGGFNAIEVMPDGRLRGYADQRRSNTAMGY
jgi:gamma-glutamyltranspeptidase/glutathione hydrolase